MVVSLAFASLRRLKLVAVVVFFALARPGTSKSSGSLLSVSTRTHGYLLMDTRSTLPSGVLLTTSPKKGEKTANETQCRI